MQHHLHVKVPPVVPLPLGNNSLAPTPHSVRRFQFHKIRADWSFQDQMLYISTENDCLLFPLYPCITSAASSLPLA